MTDELPARLPPLPFTPPTSRDAFFGNGRKPDHPFAILYQGEFETLWDGTAIAVRAHARALAQTGVPVLLRSFTGTVVDENGIARPAHTVKPNPQVAREVGALELTTAEGYYPIIKHLVVRDAEHLRRVVMPQGAIAEDFEKQAAMRRQVYASTIIYSVWERDRVDPGIAKILSRVAQCWVPSYQNAEMLEASGVPGDNIRVIPHPYDPADPLLKCQRRKADTEWRKFYSIGRWEPRKGYAELIEAFLYAFNPTDKVILTIKYTGGKWPGYPTPEETIDRMETNPAFRSYGWTADKIRERVKLIGGRFPRNAIHELHFRNNIYVSASHGEAWNLSAFEACLAGNQVVYVPSGGVNDYVGNGHVAVAPGDQEPVPKSYGWESDAYWMGFDIYDLSEALRKAEGFHSHDVTVTKGIDLRAYSFEVIGKQMLQNILDIADQRSATALYYVNQCKSREAT